MCVSVLFSFVFKMPQPPPSPPSSPPPVTETQLHETGRAVCLSCGSVTCALGRPTGSNTLRMRTLAIPPQTWCSSREPCASGTSRWCLLELSSTTTWTASECRGRRAAKAVFPTWARLRSIVVDSESPHTKSSVHVHFLRNSPRKLSEKSQSAQTLSQTFIPRKFPVRAAVNLGRNIFFRQRVEAVRVKSLGGLRFRV